jgi:hypothetical protein
MWVLNLTLHLEAVLRYGTNLYIGSCHLSMLLHAQQCVDELWSQLQRDTIVRWTLQPSSALQLLSCTWQHLWCIPNPRVFHYFTSALGYWWIFTVVLVDLAYFISYVGSWLISLAYEVIPLIFQSVHWLNQHAAIPVTVHVRAYILIIHTHLFCFSSGFCIFFVLINWKVISSR